MNRRELLRGAAILTTAAGLSSLTASCNEPIAAPTPVMDIVGRIPREALAPLTKEEAIAAIDTLSDSPYKEFLRVVKGFLGNPPPSELKLGNIVIPVGDVRMDFQRWDQQTISGRFNPRKVQKLPISTVDQDVELRMPMPHMYTLGKADIIPVKLRKGTSVAVGIEPVVTLHIPNDKNMGRDIAPLLSGIRRFTLVKELFSFAFFLHYMNDIAGVIRANNMSYTFPLGNRHVEGISTALTVIGQQEGRFAAMVDVAPMVFAAFALESEKDVLYPYTINSQFAPFLKALLGVKLGSTNEELMRESIAWVLANKKIFDTIGHVGNLDTHP